MGRSVAKAKRTLPKSSPLKVKVISALVRILSWTKKSSIFSDSHKELVLGKQGRPWELNINHESVVSFLHQPDISNCNPGWKEVKYCGKIDGEKDYQAKHHLL